MALSLELRVGGIGTLQSSSPTHEDYKREDLEQRVRELEASFNAALNDEVKHNLGQWLKRRDTKKVVIAVAWHFPAVVEAPALMTLQAELEAMLKAFAEGKPAQSPLVCVVERPGDDKLDHVLASWREALTKQSNQSDSGGSTKGGGAVAEREREEQKQQQDHAGAPDLAKETIRPTADIEELRVRVADAASLLLKPEHLDLLSPEKRAELTSELLGLAARMQNDRSAGPAAAEAGRTASSPPQSAGAPVRADENVAQTEAPRSPVVLPVDLEASLGQAEIGRLVGEGITGHEKFWRGFDLAREQKHGREVLQQVLQCYLDALVGKKLLRTEKQRLVAWLSFTTGSLGLRFRHGAAVGTLAVYGTSSWGSLRLLKWKDGKSHRTPLGVIFPQLDLVAAPPVRPAIAAKSRNNLLYKHLPASLGEGGAPEHGVGNAKRN